MGTERSNLEVGAIEQFIEAYTSAYPEARMTFLSLREPPEPDALVSFDGQPLFVEVAHVYGTEEDAKYLLGRNGNDRQRRENRFIPLPHRIVSALNKTLLSKATKKYSGDPVWLVIRSGSPIWRREDFEEHRASIAVPDTSQFQAVWLLCGPRADFGLLRLDAAA